MHLSYGQDQTRVRSYGSTTVINTTERYELEIPEGTFREKDRNRLIWKNGEPEYPEYS